MSGPKAVASMITWLLALMVAAHADAQGVAFAVVNGSYPDSELHRLNLQTGELTPVGRIGYPVTHIAFDSDGSLYGVDCNSDRLLSIHVMTGSGAPVGPLGASIVEVAGLTFGSDDRLWMTARDEILGPSLYEVDRSTGAATWRFAVDGAHFGALAADDDTLFMASSSLAVVDTSTGDVSPISGSNFGIWWARALDFDEDGSLWGLMLCGPCMTPFDVLLMHTIDPTTGTLGSDGPGEPHGTWGLAILERLLFFDGFESGDTSAWSNTVPGFDTDALRLSDLDLRDPHVFVDVPGFGCEDVTDTAPIVMPSFNDLLEEAITQDGDGDGFLDLSYLTLFHPYDPGVTGGLMGLAEASCTAPIGTTTCELAVGGDYAILTYDGHPGGPCLGPVGGTTSGYSPPVGEPVPPCFVTMPDDFVADLLGVELTLSAFQISAAADAVPPTMFTDGLLMGFLSEDDADAIMIPPDIPLIGGQPLSSILPGGTGCCAPGDDRDSYGGYPGWWFYFNFVADAVPFED